MAENDHKTVLLRGGRVLDPVRGLDARMDLRIEDGTIAALGPDLPPDGAQVHDVRGAVVTPGLVDAHVHVHATSRLAIDPDLLGVHAGVTTVVDAGSSGAATWQQNQQALEAHARTRVLAFVNLASVRGHGDTGELAKPGNVDEEAIERLAEQNPGTLVGIKLLGIRPALGQAGLEPIKRAVALGERLNLPVMVHIGESVYHAAGRTLVGDVVSAVDVVRLLRPGDIVTHLFTSHPGGLLDEENRLQPAVAEAYRNGLRFDVGHGLNNMNFDVAARVLDQGIQPHVISTDGHREGYTNVVFDLPTTMAKLLSLGFSLAEAVHKATYEPATSLRRPDLVPGLAVGQPARLSVLRVEDEEWLAEDSVGGTRTIRQKVVPVLTVIGSETYLPVSAPNHP